MTAVLIFACGIAYLLGIFGIVTGLAMFVGSQSDALIDYEAEQIATRNGWPPADDFDLAADQALAVADSDTPVHDALMIQRFRRQLEEF